MMYIVTPVAGLGGTYCCGQPPTAWLNLCVILITASIVCYRLDRNVCYHFRARDHTRELIVYKFKLMTSLVW